MSSLHGLEADSHHQAVQAPLRSAERHSANGQTRPVLTGHSDWPQRLANQSSGGPWYPGERCFTIFWLLSTTSITGWIVLEICYPLWIKQSARYNVILATIGFFTLFLAIYAFHIGLGSLLWTGRYRRSRDVDWHEAWEASTEQRKLDWSLVHHIVVITAYKEEVANLESVIVTLVAQRTSASEDQRFCRAHITVLLAMEEREGAAAREKVEYLQTKFSSEFCQILATYHPPNRPNEIAGKASNYRFAVEVVSHIIHANELTYSDGSVVKQENVVIHVADGDSLYDPNHFPNVNYDFCVCPDRELLVWQPCMLPTCNFWSVAPCIRQFGIMISAQEMLSATGLFEFQIPFSTYGLAFTTLQFIGGDDGAGVAQDGDVIAEDHHMFIKGFFATSGRLRVKPIYLPCFNYTVEGCECLSKSCCCFGRRRCPTRQGCDSRFSQATRHMYAVSELAYFCSLFARGGCCGRRYKFGPRRIRVLYLFAKLLKIHSIAYIGLWVTLGAILFVCLKFLQTYCEAWNVLSPELGSGKEKAPEVCDTDFEKITFTVGASLFSSFSALAFVGTVMVHVSFTRMLRAMQVPMSTIADPTNIDGQRRLVDVNQGGPWLGTVVQLVLEYAVFGFGSSLYYGTVPSFIALIKLMCRGHRFTYVSASDATTQGTRVEQHQLCSSHTASARHS
mmetsp:Transcript_87469/g.183076  ORF Transcript_87469/g.183076 Transcript_87469/m.183076 type:complete len:676 (+) Transcript_87469:50-2077(+)